MNKTEKYEVDLFGQQFVLSTNDGKKHELEKVVNFYKKMVESLEKKLPDRPQLDIAILAGLKITDKLYSLAKSKDIKIDNEDKLKEKIDDVIKRLEFSLNK